MERSDYEKILPKLGIKDPDEDLWKNETGKEFLQFCINHNVEVPPFDEDVHATLDGKIVLFLVEELPSFDRVIEVLKNMEARDQAAFDFPDVADWYEVYEPGKLNWFNEGFEILISEEYLDLAPVEWTENEFYHFNKWFFWNGKGYELKENTKKPSDADYYNPFFDNVDTLTLEKREGRLDKAVEFLMKATKEV